MGNSSSISIPAAEAEQHHQQLESLLEELCNRLRRETPSDAVLRRSGCLVVDMELYQLKELKDHWQFVKLFIDCTSKWSDANSVVESCGRVIAGAEAEAAALARTLSVQKSSRNLRSFLKMMRNEIQEWILRFIGLELEIARAVDSILGKFLSLEICSPLVDLYSWIKFAESAGKVIKHLAPEAFSHLEHLTSFIRHVLQGSESGLMLGSSSNRTVIVDFFAHIASVVFRAACLCIIVKKLGSADHRSLLTEVSDEISIAKPKFLDFVLSFLEALKDNERNGKVSRADWVELFLSAFYIKSRCKSEAFLRKELKEIVIYLVGSPRNLADTKLVILEAIHIVHSNPGYHCSCFTVCWNVWLFRVGLFLTEQCFSGTVFKLSAKDEIAYLEDSLEMLKRYCPAWESNSAEDHMLAKQVSADVKSLYQSFHDNGINEYVVRIAISQLLSHVALLRTKSALMKLLDLNGIVIAHLRSEFQFLLEHIKLFTSTVIMVKAVYTVDEKKRYEGIESVCMRVLYLCYSIHTEQTETAAVRKEVGYLLDTVRMLKKQHVLQIPKTNFPRKSAGMGFFDRLLGNLLELCKRECDPFFRGHMEDFHMELESLRSQIRGASQQGCALLERKDLGARVTKLIYELEYVIDCIEVGLGAQWQQILWINEIGREIVFVKTLAGTKLIGETCEGGCHHLLKNPSNIARSGKLEVDKLVVRLRDQEDLMIDRLTRGFSRRDLVSIVGMPGLGKTTLAKKLYNDPRVSYYFHSRAWCFVSQSYKKRDLLLKLLGDVQGLTDEIHEMDDSDLELKLWRCLKGKRYLVVMDDVWDVGAWKDLQTSFPDDSNGSRVMITSRLYKVPMDAMPGSMPHQLRALSADESWKLLELRIFHEEDCPEKLVQLGKEIAEQCKGLALAIVAVAGVLEKTEKKHASWQQILKELNTRVIDDPVTQCKTILEMSYNHLPDYLKACFLYFGTFQLDGDVKARKLIQMWIAEGFLQNTELKSLEEQGEESLMDLIDRSLVMVSKRKSMGGVKACQMHDLLRELCLSKSKEENFLQLITGVDEPYASYHYLYDGVDFDYADPQNLVKFEGYRVCTILRRKHFIDSEPSGPSTRSLIFIASSDVYPRRPYNVSFIFENFKLLRVLDLEGINLGISFPIAIEFLVLLRYLALGGDLDSIPECISNLWKLETFILKGLSGKIVLPDSFWCMTSLRHVHVKNQAAFDLLGDNFGSSILLDNLVTFSSPALSYGKDTEKILRKLPNLLKLRCIFLESRDSSGNCNPFPALDFLVNLVSLNILYAGRDRNPGEFSLPLNLRKLTLSRFRLSWGHVSTIGRLPNLEVLKLFSVSFEGLTWEMKEEEFSKLKFLKLDSLNTVRWNTTSDHLPNLEQLVLWNCRDLEEVPYEFSEIATLQIIEVRRCSQSLEESIKNIEEVVEGLQVLISH